MDVNTFLNNINSGVVPNPKYNPRSKKNKQPRFISGTNLTPAEPSFAVSLATIDYATQDVATEDEVAKFKRNGLNFNRWENIDKQLADKQSNWAKLGNSLAQAVVSEIGLGTVGAFADIFDFITSNIFQITEDDYQNPVSSKITEWQETFKNEIAPVYADPNINIQNGGLADFGWWAKNIPTVASTLMLLLPAKGISMGIARLVRGSKVARGIGNARRWATGINKLEDASQMSKWQAAINSSRGINIANKAVQTTGEALLMRTAENYQEARQTYIPTYEYANEELNKLTDEQLQELVAKNPNFFDKNKVDVTNRDEIAKYIARNAADRTFAMDFTNIIFDIIQLYGLRNMGKGIKSVTRTAKVNKLQQQSIADAANIKPVVNRGASAAAGATDDAAAAATNTGASTAGKAASEATKSSFSLNKLSSYAKGVGVHLKDFARFQGKTTLMESTEGIEEAINYIAQQEGLTYGKMLLAAQTDGYTDSSFFTAIPKAWNNMQGDMQDYLRNPELQESAFWGLMGGLVFGNIGNVTNRAQLAIERRAAAKLRKENEKTGESTPLDRITQLFENHENRVTRMGMQKRLDEFNKLQERMQIIADGRDPYSDTDEHGRYTEFKGDTESRTAIARARAISDFRSELAIDAVNSGTYELLTEYLNSKEVKQAMINLGMTTNEEVESFVQETLNDMESAKDEYAKQSAFVLNQVAFLNNQHKNRKRKRRDDNLDDDDSNTDIPEEYARLIAKDNYDRARTVATIEKQLSVLGTLEAEQENILAQLNPDINPAMAKEAVALGALFSTYRALDVQEREINEKEANTSIAKLQKFSMLEQIKSQKKNLIKELKRRGINGNVNPIANIFTAFVSAKRAFRDPTTGEIKEVINATDEEILKEFRLNFKEDLNDVSDESILHSAKVLSSEINSIINDNDDGLIKLNNRLFELYQNRISLEIQKELQRSLIMSSTDQIRERVNYYHNVHNEVRAARLGIAEEVIRKAVEEYSGIIDDSTGHDLIPAIIAAYNGDKTEARRIAEEVMASPGEGAVTASEFIDALDILALHRESNKDLINWIGAVFGERGKQILQDRVRKVQNTQTDQNKASDTEENDDTSNTSDTTTNDNTNAPTVPQGQSTQPVQPTQPIQPISPTNPQPAQPIRQQPIQPQRRKKVIKKTKEQIEQSRQQQQQAINKNANGRRVIGVTLIINNRGNIVSVKSVNTDKANNNNNIYTAYINPNGTIEIDASYETKEKQLKLIRTGLFNISKVVDFVEKEQEWTIINNPTIKAEKNKPIKIVQQGLVDVPIGGIVRQHSTGNIEINEGNGVTHVLPDRYTLETYKANRQLPETHSDNNYFSDDESDKERTERQLNPNTTDYGNPADKTDIDGDTDYGADAKRDNTDKEIKQVANQELIDRVLEDLNDRLCRDIILWLKNSNEKVNKIVADYNSDTSFNALEKAKAKIEEIIGNISHAHRPNTQEEYEDFNKLISRLIREYNNIIQDAHNIKKIKERSENADKQKETKAEVETKAEAETSTSTSPVEKNDNTNTNISSTSDTSATAETDTNSTNANETGETKAASTTNSEPASNNSSTGDVTYEEGEITNLDQDINSAIYGNIPNLLADDINFDDIEVKAIATVSAKYPKIDKQTIVNSVKSVIESTKQAREMAKSLNSPAMRAGFNLVNFAKVEDSVDLSFSRAFSAAAEAFLQEYSKLLIVKKIDGKQVVRLEDILRLTKKAYPMDSAEAAAFYNIIRNYLIANQARYEIIDLNEGEKIFDRLDKTSQQVAQEEYGDEVRINIRDFIESTDANDNYFKVLDELKVGDKVSLSKDGNKIYVSANGQVIGSMSIPSVDGDAYLQLNQGWITDVKTDANGNPVSEVMDIIIGLFLDKGTNNDSLRELLTRLSVNPKNITEEDVEEFSMNPLIALLATQARARAKNGKSRTILHVNKNGDIDFKSALLHLTRLWKYTNTSNIATRKEDVEEAIADNILIFFNKLYNNYKSISNLQSGSEAVVTKKNGTTAVRAIEGDTFDNYEQLPLAGDVIVDKDNARISIVTINKSNNVAISGRPDINKTGFIPGSTFLSMFGTDGEPDFVKAYGVKLSDRAATSTGFLSTMGLAAFNHFEEVISKFFRPNFGVANSTDELETFIKSLIAVDGSNTIPLFRAIRGKFQIEPIVYADNRASGIKIVYFERGKAPSRFYIYNKTNFGKPFGYSVQDGVNSVKITTTAKEITEGLLIRKTTEALIEFLKSKCCVNIDTKGINSDSLDNTNYDGFINRKDGKLVIDIPNNRHPEKAVHKEFDSYNSFLIDNNLIRVNTKKSANGTNFERFGENQRANSILYVSLPKPVEVANDITASAIHVEEGTTEEDYNAFLSNFDKNEANNEQVLNAIIGEEETARLKQVAGDEQLHILDLFPQKIEFIPGFNYYGSPDINSQPLAATTGNRKEAKFYVYKDGVKTRTTRRGANRTFIGSKFVNMAASSTKGRRYNAIKVLMHERIHNILQNRTDKSKNLLKELEEVYNDFATLLTNDLTNNNLTDSQKAILSKLLQVYKKEFAKHKELISKGYSASYRHVEEFLVDSMTNGVLHEYLNSKEVENAKDNGKPDNLLTRIIKAIAKFFGWTSPKDGTLLMKELNIIRDIYKDVENVAELVATETTTTETTTTETSTEITTETEVKEETEQSNTTNEQSTETSSQTDDAKTDDKNENEEDDDDLDSAIEELKQKANQQDDDLDDLVELSTVEDAVSTPINNNNNRAYTLEMQSIKDKAIADGTFMKAPNGNPTNLTEAQWLQVRTKNFINWFGDWLNVNTFNTNAIDTSKVDYEIVDKPWRTNKNKSNKSLRIYIKEQHNKGYFELVKDIEFGIYSVHFKTGDANTGEIYGSTKKERDILYDQIFNALPNGSQLSTWGELSEGGIKALNKLGKSLNKVGERTVKNRKGDFINIPIYQKGKGVSKIVDENGEPLVVYHYTNENFDTFDIEYSMQKDPGDFGKGFYFTNSKNYDYLYDNYGYIQIGAFLNIRNPFIADTKEKKNLAGKHFNRPLAQSINKREELKRKIDSLKTKKALSEEKLFSSNPDYVQFKNEDYAGTQVEKSRLAQYNKQISSLEEELNKLEKDYDINEEYNSNIQKLQKYDGVISGNTFEEIVAINPNQIKSATSNNGDFSTSNDDIYNSTVEDATEFDNNIKTRIKLGKELQPNTKYGQQGETDVVRYEVLNENNNVIGDVQLEFRKNRKSVVLHPQLQSGKGYGQELYQYIANTFNTVVEESFGEISKSEAAEKMWKSLVEKGIATYELADENLYLRRVYPSNVRYNNNNDFIFVGNIDAFGNQLPLEQRAHYTSLIDQGAIETKCR